MSDQTEEIIRPLRDTDWPDVKAIQAAAFPPEACEDIATFACHAALSPSTCFTAEVDHRVVAYLLAHPWQSTLAPPINTLYSALPPDCDALFIHDLAVHPDARGTGLARRMVETLLHTPAASTLPMATLVSVQDTARFWERFGFEITASWPKELHERMQTMFPNGNFVLMHRRAEGKIQPATS